MHHPGPGAQKRWIQEQVRGRVVTAAEGRAAANLGAAQLGRVFERFLHTRYVGQKRFGLEGAESTIIVLDNRHGRGSQGAAPKEWIMGMAHRGRLTCSPTSSASPYQENFGEFEGNLDRSRVPGSGDVKYHKGAMGKFTGRSGIDLTITMASNPSHLEAVDPGRRRHGPGQAGPRAAATDAPPPPWPGANDVPLLSLLVHGDAAFAGQGVVAETLNLSQLSGYRTGGRCIWSYNNQVGFTTAPRRRARRCTPPSVARWS